jgi:hypothetical protein
MKLFAVTVLYTHNDGRTVEAMAVVGAPNAIEAIDAATEGVKALPHCREVEGGMCEELADLEPSEAPNARGATHPTHGTVN